MRIHEYSGASLPRGYVTEAGWKATRASAVLAVLLSKYDLTWKEIEEFKQLNEISDWDANLSTGDSTLIAEAGEIYLPDGLSLNGWSEPYTLWKNRELDVSLPAAPVYVPPAPEYVAPTPAYVPPAATPEPDFWEVPEDQSFVLDSQAAPAYTPPAPAYVPPTATPIPVPPSPPTSAQKPADSKGVPMWLIIGGAVILVYFLTKGKRRSKKR